MNVADALFRWLMLHLREIILRALLPVGPQFPFLFSSLSIYVNFAQASRNESFDISA